MSGPTRREFLQESAAAAAAWMAQDHPLAHAESRRPSLVYVFADQLRYQSCGYAGDEYARTPNIDRLAGQGINFRNAISSSPVCAPYRASLLTGKCQSSTGMVINELRLSPAHECFGHVLTRHGYQTAYIGKWHLWANQLGHHEETINGFVPPGPYRMGFGGFWAAYNFNHQYYRAPYFKDDMERQIHKGYEPDSQTDMAIEFIRWAAQQSRPFALFLSWGPPHDPWGWDNAPPEHADLFRDVNIPLRRNYSEIKDPYADAWGTPPDDYKEVVHRYQRVYYAQAANLDWNLGRLVKVLDEEGLADQTVLVFTSDHGEMFGSHGRRAKYIFYEEAARVPFLVRWPGRIPAGSQSAACLGTPDIMPTLLSLLRLPTPKAVEGMDLSHLALGTSGPEPDAAFLQGMGTTAAWSDGTEWRAVRDKQYTYAIYRRDRRELFFDNVADPFQMKNIAADRAHRPTLTHYRQKLQSWMRERNDGFQACTWYRNHWTRDRNIIQTASGVSQDLLALEQIIREHFPSGPS